MNFGHDYKKISMRAFMFPGPGTNSTRAQWVQPVSSITIYIAERELALYIRATTHFPD